MTHELILMLTAVAAAGYLLHRHPKFLAGMLWSFLPVYGQLITEGRGLLTAVIALAVIAVRCKTPGTSAWLHTIGGLALAMVTAVWIQLYSIGAVTPKLDGAAMAMAITLAFLVSWIGLSPVSGKSIVGGVLLGTTTLAVAEIIRVATGGSIHAQHAAFGINPIVLGQYALIGVLLSWHLRLRDDSKYRWVLLSIVNACGLLATGSRGPLLGLAVAIIVLAIQYSRKKGRNAESPDKAATFLTPLALATSIIVFVAVAISDDPTTPADASITSRLLSWGAAVESIFAAPLTGHGPGQYGSSGDNALGLLQTPHNIYLEAWAEYGLVAIATLAAALIALTWASRPNGIPLSCAAVICYFFSGTLGTTVPLWTMLALAVVIQHQPASGVESERDSEMKGAVLR